MSLVKSQQLSEENAAKLQQLIDAIPEILTKSGDASYDEIYGYRIAPDSEEYVDVTVRNEILLKFLIATAYNVDEAKEKLANTLKWRKEFQVLNAAYVESYDADLEKLGVISYFPNNKDNFRVVTWNLYANLKNPKKLFARFGVGVNEDGSEAAPNDADVPGTMFLRWRIGLMERALTLLDFTDKDNCKAAQVHDYNNVSMFRMDPGMKAATKDIIKVFGDNYPELLSKKYFINVSYLMGWIFTFFKATGLISADTVKKFEMLNHGDLSESFGKDNLPKDYNGGVANEKVPDVFTSAAKESQMKIPEYGGILLEKLKTGATKTVSEPTKTETVPDATESVA